MSRRSAKGATATSAFGVGARESHDASAFYARFHPKVLSTAETVTGPLHLNQPLVCGDSRALDLPDDSVALVVTSPPYFVGKAYEEAMGQGVIPASYAEYLQMLGEVFRECRRVLEPGGRLAVNVANLGRRPYRSLAADVVRILDDDLGMLLRGEVVWRKAEGASGSCAWGSFRSPTNPVLRDTTERVVVASKGRFDRALDVRRRRAAGLPHRSTITTDEFLEATLDVWDIRPESARRVRHPAPFPVELPQRLIELYTFAGDLVLDPFLGSGTTAVAAVRTGRRYVGYDTDPEYVELARARVAAEHVAAASSTPVAANTDGCAPDFVAPDGPAPDGPEHGAPGDGVMSVALRLVADAGFTVVERDHRLPGVGVVVPIVALDAGGGRWSFDVTGAFTTTRGGLARTDVLWRAIGRAAVLAGQGVRPLVMLSSDLPPRRSTGDQALRAMGPGGPFDVVALTDPAGRARLAGYAAGDLPIGRRPGFWTDAELAAPPPDARGD